MKKLTLTIGMLLGIIAIASLTVAAQARRGDTRDQVCFYENNFFGGWQQCLLPGEQVGDLGAHRNQISSIRVFGDARVTAFMDKNFEGSSLDVNSDLNDLAQQRMGSGIIAGNWNDKIESVRVTSRLGNTVVVVPRDDNPVVAQAMTPTTATAERTGTTTGTIAAMGGTTPFASSKRSTFAAGTNAMTPETKWRTSAGERVGMTTSLRFASLDQPA